MWAPSAMLTVNEIFHSIQGESTHTGRPCVFVRLTGCDLRCVWCDTPYAFHEGRKLDVDEVVETLRDRPGRQYVVVTGRRAHPDLVAAADLVTEMTKVKHQMDRGQKGQRGIEW